MDVAQVVAQAREVGFHLREMELLEASHGRVTIRLPVASSLLNIGGVIHGGAIATLIDDCGSVAVIATDAEGRNGVSTDLNVTQVTSASEGQTLVAEASVLRSGRRLAFVSVDVRVEGSGDLIAQGRLTKAL